MFDGGFAAWVTLIASFVGSGGLVGWAVNYLNNRTTREKDWYDQLQEDRNTDRQQLVDLRAEVQQIKNRERVRDDYIEQLRLHISDNKPPPPPPWPESLRTA